MSTFHLIHYTLASLWMWLGYSYPYIFQLFVILCCATMIWHTFLHYRGNHYFICTLLVNTTRKYRYIFSKFSTETPFFHSFRAISMVWMFQCCVVLCFCYWHVCGCPFSFIFACIRPVQGFCVCPSIYYVGCSVIFCWFCLLILCHVFVYQLRFEFSYFYSVFYFFI